MLELCSVTKKYKDKLALDQVSLKLDAGIYGLLGPNGAGKSTTIKMLAGILVPTGGTVSVLGKDPFKFRKDNAFSVGAVFGQRTQLWWDLPIRFYY